MELESGVTKTVDVEGVHSHAGELHCCKRCHTEMVRIDRGECKMFKTLKDSLTSVLEKKTCQSLTLIDADI